jgi:hypothetical protein
MKLLEVNDPSYEGKTYLNPSYIQYVRDFTNGTIGIFFNSEDEGIIIEENIDSFLQKLEAL